MTRNGKNGVKFCPFCGCPGASERTTWLKARQEFEAGTPFLARRANTEAAKTKNWYMGVGKHENDA